MLKRRKRDKRDFRRAKEKCMKAGKRFRTGLFLSLIKSGWEGRFCKDLFHNLQLFPSLQLPLWSSFLPSLLLVNVDCGFSAIFIFIAAIFSFPSLGHNFFNYRSQFSLFLLSRRALVTLFLFFHEFWHFSTFFSLFCFWSPQQILQLVSWQPKMTRSFL